MVADRAPVFLTGDKQLRRSKGCFYIHAKNFNLFLVGKWFLKLLSPVLLAFKLQEFLILIIVCLLALDFYYICKNLLVT